MTPTPAPDPTPHPTWWCSFADRDRFLGVVVTAAPTLAHAARRAASLGVNPGGEVRGVPVPGALVPAADRDRLLTAAEARDLDRRLALAAALLAQVDPDHDREEEP